MYDIYFDLKNMHQTVDEGESLDLSKLYDELTAISQVQQSHQIEFDFEIDLPEGDNADFDDYPVVVRRSGNGYTCKNCGEHYPYADEPNQLDGSFKCWSCRNS
jgi:hypothetical protein